MWIKKGKRGSKPLVKLKIKNVDIKVNLWIKKVVELVMFKDKKIKKEVMIYMVHGNMDTWSIMRVKYIKKCFEKKRLLQGLNFQTIFNSV